jgi:hypothetical protein
MRTSCPLRVFCILLSFLTVSAGAQIQIVNNLTLAISDTPPPQEAGPFSLLGVPLTLPKGFAVKLELAVTHHVEVSVAGQTFSFDGKGGAVAGSGSVFLHGGKPYEVTESYDFTAAVQSVFIRGEFPVAEEARWELTVPETGVYRFELAGSARDVLVQVGGDAVGEAQQAVLGERIVLDVATARVIPGGQKLVYQATFRGSLTRVATLAFTGERAPVWDVDRNGVVDIVDLVRVALRFGDAGEGIDVDLNRDGVVDIVDIVLVALHFGERTAPAAPASVHHGRFAGVVRLAARTGGDGPAIVDVYMDAPRPAAAYAVEVSYDPERWLPAGAYAGAYLHSVYAFSPRAEDGAVRLAAVGLPPTTPVDTAEAIATFVFIPRGGTTRRIRERAFSIRWADASDARARRMHLRLGASSASGVAPARTVLGRNYPNPCNPETWIPFTLAEEGAVRVEVYTQDGRLVRALDLGTLPAGDYSAPGRAAYWDGRNGRGEPVASGIYVYRLIAGDVSRTRRMVLAK